VIQLAQRPFLHHVMLTLWLAALGACHMAVPDETVPRRLGGESVPGSFVPPFAYEAYVRGELALAEGKADEAVRQLELATAAPFEDAYLLSRLAYAQSLAGHRKDAAQTLAHAEALDACSEALWLTRAAMADDAKELEAAESAYARAVACAPASSRAVLGLAHVLSQRGKDDDAVALLERFVASQPGAAQVADASLELSLHSNDGARVAQAVDGWLAAAPTRSAALRRAQQWALEHGRPELALRLYEHDPAGQQAELECRIHAARGDRERVRAVLARADASALGGTAQAAEYALFAGAYDRAELEASALIVQEPSDRAHALRARARVMAGRRAEAVDDLLAVHDPDARRKLALELLAASGAAALARELERPKQNAKTQ
jgi:tetratricopeptide (TPR) repeat protein